MTENDAELNPDPHGIGAIRPSVYKIGDAVRYYPVLPDGEVPRYEETKIRSEPWQLGHGAWVIKVEGRTGGVLTEHLAPILAAGSDAELNSARPSEYQITAATVGEMVRDEIATLVLDYGHAPGDCADRICALVDKFRARPAPATQKIAFDDVIDFLITNGIELSTVNQSMVAAALAKHGGNQTAAAARIGLTRDQLRYRLAKTKDKPSPE